MKKESNSKMIIGIINLCIIILAGFSRFITFETKIFNTFDVKGSYLVLLGSILLIYSIKIKNKISSMISYSLFAAGYIITFMKLYQVINQVKGILGISYGIGFYLYVLSCIIFIVNLFINNGTENKTENESKENSDLIEGLDKESFILCNMVLGIKEIAYDSLVLLKKDDENYLSISYRKEENVASIQIPIKDIQSVEAKPDLSISYSNDQVNDSETANMLLSYSVLGGVPFLALGGNALLNNLTEEYNKQEVKCWYVITINYVEKKEMHEIKLKTKYNPQEFVDKIKKENMK